MRDEDRFMELWKALPKELQDELAKAVEKSSAASPEEFAWEIFVGPCPRCGSKETRDCEGVAGIEDINIGLCNKCGHLWCTECRRPAVIGTPCGHWETCERCLVEKGRPGDCGIPAADCPSVAFSGDLTAEETVYACAWCNKEIDKDAEVFGLGARTRKSVRLTGCEGARIRIPLTHTDKVVSAIVPLCNSEAKKTGNDVLFTICSRKCGELLKRALLKEKFRIVRKG
jgi:hypothetical protein